MHVQAGAGIVYDSNPASEQAGMRQQGQGAVPRRRGEARPLLPAQRRASSDGQDPRAVSPGGPRPWAPH